jgi:putative transposase
MTRLWLVQSIDRAREQYGFRLWAWVIMPEHVHLLLHPEAEDYSITRIRQSIKGPFAGRVLGEWRDHAPHKLARLGVKTGGKASFRFWQAGGGFDRNLYKMSRIRKVIEYIEYNPVRRGLVSEPADWRWSSARFRVGMGETPLLIDGFEFDDARITGI